MDFIWNDGGRASCGYVGLAGDCVTRSVAIATGISYRTVYEALGTSAQKSPRNGLPSRVAAEYLSKLDWRWVDGGQARFEPTLLPKGIIIADLIGRHGRGGHFTAVIDQVIHDTWNPAEDEFHVVGYWLPPEIANESTSSHASAVIRQPNQAMSHEQELTQKEFDKILRRLRALDKTASNQASTEGEKRNALRMMQTLLLQHNLSRDDITEKDNSDLVQFARMSCVLNGSRACNWEYSLAHYVCVYVFPLVQYYASRRGHRTRFQFYGPRQDVQNCIELFRELLLTIASSAMLQFGGYSRSSGASYAEGYVAGLPRDAPSPTANAQSSSEGSSSGSQLIQNRAIIFHRHANKWLKEECGITLETTKSSGRYLNDPSARSLGTQHGSTHEIRTAHQPKRLN